MAIIELWKEEGILYVYIEIKEQMYKQLKRYRRKKIYYSRLSLSRNRRDPQKHFEISVLRHIRFIVLRKKQFEQPIFSNDYVI